MTKKQIEAIEYFENKIKDVKPEYIETYVDGKLIRSETISLKMRFDKEDADKMGTVLNMLKEKDKEIEKKDKIIDLMTEYINYLSDELVQATGKNELDFCDGNKCCKDSDYSCEECIKQYFERKAEE